MTTRLANLCFDANNPVRLARFWASALRWEIYDETHDEVGVLPSDVAHSILIEVDLGLARSDAKNRAAKAHNIKLSRFVFAKR